MKSIQKNLFILAGCLLFLFETGCSGPCSCDWEGGQIFTVTNASQDGSKLYLEITVKGEPCCEDTWEHKKVYLLDFTGYTGGDLKATVVTASAGKKLSVAEKDKMELTNLGFILQRNPDLVQVSILTTSVKLFQISEKTSGTVRGYAIIPAGSLIK